MHCRICDSADLFFKISVPDIRFKTTKKIFNVFECSNCGVFITLEDDHIVDSDNYYCSDYGAFKGKDIKRVVNNKRIDFRFLSFLNRETWGYIASNRLSWIKDAGLSPRMKVLDVGCGTGKISSLLQHHFECDVIGIEPNLLAASKARKKGLRIHNGTLADFEGHSDFDLVILIHVLEHLASPLEDLLHVRRLLKPEGRLVIIVPNVDGIERKIFRKYWDGWDIPRHIHHFRPRSLCYLLEKTNFEINSFYYEQYSQFSRSLANKIFKELPYHQRKKRCRIDLFESAWGFFQALLKSSSSIQLIATCH